MPSLSKQESAKLTTYNLVFQQSFRPGLISACVSLTQMTSYLLKQSNKQIRKEIKLMYTPMGSKKT